MNRLFITGKRRNMVKLKTKYREQKPEYYEIIKKGLEMYDKEVGGYRDPEDWLTSQEWEDMVGLRG